MDITIYGTGTSGTELIKSVLETFLNQAGIDFNMKEVNDVNEFMEKKIQSVPAVMVDDSELYVLKENGRFTESLRNLIQSILKKEDYGTMNKIIVPTDFSDTSMKAFSFANRYAKDVSGMIKVVHVYYPSSADINGNVFVDVGLKNVKQALLNDFVKSVNQDWIGEVMSTSLIDKCFAEGFPVPSIIEVAEKNNACCIIIGTNGEGETFKKIFGSVSTELVKKSPIPVIVVPPEAVYKGFKKILYASQDANLDKKCMDRLCSFSQLHEAELHIVHVARSADDSSNFSGTEIESYCDQVETKVSLVVNDDVEEGLHQYAKDNNIDLIVLSSKRRSFIENIFHSSVSKRMVMHTHIPIMVLHDNG